MKLLIEKLNMSEADVDISNEVEDISGHTITSKVTPLNLGEVGFLETIAIKDMGEVQLIFKDAIIRLKIREN